MTSATIVCDPDEYTEYEDPGDAGGGPSEHSASGSANGDEPWGWGYGSGSLSYYTTEEGTFTWSYYVYVWAEAHVYLSPNYQSCYASASASSPKGSPGFSASAFVTDGDYNGDWHVQDADGAYFDDDQDTDSFGVYGGVSSSHSASASAGVIQGSNDYAFSHACSRGFCNMY